MNIALWVLQSALGMFFLVGGGMKVLAFEKYKQRILARSKTPDLGYSQGFLTFIGVCEIAGGLGLILPMALGIAPVLTPLAATGLAVIMIGATVFHLRRKAPPGANGGPAGAAGFRGLGTDVRIAGRRSYAKS